MKSNYLFKFPMDWLLSIKLYGQKLMKTCKNDKYFKKIEVYCRFFRKIAN